MGENIIFCFPGLLVHWWTKGKKGIQCDTNMYIVCFECEPYQVYVKTMVWFSPNIACNCFNIILRGKEMHLHFNINSEEYYCLITYSWNVYVIVTTTMIILF